MLVPARARARRRDGGQGTYGEADDKVVTNAGFIVIAFFPLLIFALSMLQWRLDKRKDARKAADEAPRGQRRLARRLVARSGTRRLRTSRLVRQPSRCVPARRYSGAGRAR